MGLVLGSEDRELSDPYQWWQERLAEEYFSTRHAGRPAIMFTDEQEAARLREPGQLELTDAVSAKLAWGDQYVFSPIMRRIGQWRRSTRDEPPPCLPLLAVCVLAASRMRRDDLGSTNNYYLRLAQCMPSPVGYTETELKQQLRCSYADVPGMWETLDEWLRKLQDKRGVSTIFAGRLTRIGYALSQALIRASDHAPLTRFFHAVGVRSGYVITPENLMHDLRIWGAHRQGLSQRLRAALNGPPDADEAHILGTLVCALAKTWDGVVITPLAGERQLFTLLPALENQWPHGWTARWHAPAIRGVVSDTIRYNGGAFGVALNPDGGTFDLSGDVPDIAETLSTGLRADGSALAIQMRRATIVPMQEDPVAGAWLATSEIATHEPYTLLVRQDNADRAGQLLRRAGADLVDPIEAPLDGWLLFEDVRFPNRDSLEVSLREMDLAVDCESGARPRLVNGLPIGTHLGRRNYLVGGAPDLVLPDSGSRQAIVDGMAVQADKNTGLVRLRSLATAVGEHFVEVGRYRLSFNLHPSTRAGSSASVPAVVSAMAGVPDSITVRPGGDARFLRSDGRFERIHEPLTPRWWDEEKTGLCACSYDVPIPQDAVWMADIHGQEVTIVQLRDQPPIIGRLSQEAQQFWARILLENQSGKPHMRSWKRYREAVINRLPKQVFS